MYLNHHLFGRKKLSNPSIQLMYFEISREFFLHKRVMDQIDISSEDLEDGEVPDSDEDITIINIVPLEKSKILRYHSYIIT